MQTAEEKSSLLDSIKNLGITVEHTKNGLELQCSSSNTLTDIHIQNIVAPFLRLHPEIVSVNLSQQKIGNEGAIELANIESIQSLDLSFNSIGDGGARALGFNDTLQTLILTGNPFLRENSDRFKPTNSSDRSNSITGIPDVGEVFRNNRTLLSLVLGSVIESDYTCHMNYPMRFNNVPLEAREIMTRNRKSTIQDAYHNGMWAHYFAGRGSIPYPMYWCHSSTHNTKESPNMQSLEEVKKFQEEYKKNFPKEYKSVLGSYLPVSSLVDCVESFVGKIEKSFPRKECAREPVPDMKPSQPTKPSKFQFFWSTPVEAFLKDKLDEESDRTGNAISRSVSNTDL